MNTLKYLLSLLIMTNVFTRVEGISGELYFVGLMILSALYMVTGSYSEKVCSFKIGNPRSNRKENGNE